MGDKARLFVAARLPQRLLDALAERLEPIRDEFPGARWIPIANQHVTLKFVGWFPNDERAAAERVIEEACTGIAGAEIAVGGFGAFPSSRRIRVLWAGIVDETKLLARLARRLDEGFGALGVPPENRDFSPHLTLARFKTPIARREAMPALALDDPYFSVGTVELFSSRLSPGGARYEILRSFVLDG